MPTPEEYYRQQQEEAQNALRRSALIVSQPLEKTPDEYAKAAAIAKSVALPTALIEPNIKTFQQRMLEKRTEMVLGTAPALTDWITRDDNYRIAQDDIDGLSWWEKGLPGVVTNAMSREVRRWPQIYYQWSAMNAAERDADKKRGFGEILNDETSVTVRGERVQVGSAAFVGAPDLLAAASRWATSRLSDAFGYDEKATAAAYQQKAGEAAKGSAAVKMSEAGERGKVGVAKINAAADWQTALQTFAQVAADDPAGLLAFLGETALESVPRIGAAAVVGAVTKSPAAAATFMGGASAATEYGTAPVEFFQEHGIDVSTPDGAMAALNDPELMRKADERGVTRGLVIGIMDGLSGGVAGQMLSKSVFGNLALQSVVQAGMGAGGEALGQVASGQDLKLGDIIVEGLAEFATAPLEVAGIGGRAMIENRAKAREAATNAQTIADISSQAQASILRQRMPEKFREYIAAATVDGPVENVYVPAQDFVEYFQSQGIDPFDLTDELEGVSRDDLSAALAGGGDLRIPTATYASALAGSAADPFLMENMRFSPDAMTTREAAEFNAMSAEVMEEAWQEAERIRVQEESLRGVEERIFTDMQSRLRQAGRTTDVANAEATLYPAFYRVMAQRSGMPVEEFLARYPLPQVEGVMPQGITSKDVTALNRTLAEARMRRAPVADKRQSLLEFISERGGINDVGGELKARDARVVKQGRGKKNLKLARDMSGAGQGSMLGGGAGGISYSVDDVARAAIEAGFMADNPEVLAYKHAMAEGGEVPDIVPALWDAIDRELRGERQTSADEAAPDTERDEALDQLEEYLASLGASLDDDDAAILAAIRQDEDARRYAQGGDDQPLYVVHNLSADKLRHAAELGGLAAPSLAVARGDIGFDGYGDISLIGDPSLANPKGKGVRLFSADVYSPRQPRARFKVNEKARAAMRKVLAPAAEKLGLDIDRQRLGQDDIERGGLSEVEMTDAAKAAWLESKGEAIPFVYREAKAPDAPAGLTNFTATDEADLLADPAFIQRMQRKYELALKTAEGKGREFQRRVDMAWLDENGEVSANSEAVENWARVVAKYNRELAEFKPGFTDEVDTFRTGDAMTDAIGDRMPEYRQWVRDQFGDVVGPAFFEDANGRKRDYTLTNLVREMTRELRNGESWNYGAGNVRAAVAPEFKSVADVKDARGQITSEKEMEAAKDEVNNELFALAEKFAPYHSSGQDFGWADIFTDFLKDVAKGPRALNEWQTQWFNEPVPDELIDEARAFLEKLKSLPTNYFEIKMQRAMGLDEFTAALIPSDLSQEARDTLTAAGLELVEYNKGDEGSRTAALQKIGGKVFFQSDPATDRRAEMMAAREFFAGMGPGEFRNTVPYSSEPDYHRFQYVTPDGVAVTGNYTLDGDTIDNFSITSEGGPRSVGAKVTREIGRALKAAHPEAKTLMGYRLSGARRNAGGGDEFVSFDLRRFYQSSEEPLIVYRGEGGDSGGGNYFSFDREFARNFTRSGQDKEIREAAIAPSDVYEAETLPLATNEGQIDAAIAEAQAQGKKAIRVDEGDGEPNSIFVFDKSAIKTRRAFEQDGSNAPRGSIQFPAAGLGNGDTIIRLSEKADLSTFLHESGHYFLTVMQDMAEKGEPSAANEFQAVKGWWRENAKAVASDARKAFPESGVTDADVIAALDTGTTGDMTKDAAIDVGMQEQWARGFEQYVMEGKAPSAELRSAFERFRAWLISVYRKLSGLNVAINDDLRQVFNRMLATDEEIAQATEDSGGDGMVFATAEEMGLTPEEYSRFLTLRQQAEEEGKARLLKETMAPVKRAQQQWYKEERATVHEEMSAQINREPVYRAIEWMGNRRWIGEDAPEAMPDIRLSKDILVDRYGAGILKTLPRGQQTVYTVDGGLDPDDAAGWFGFDSGDQMLQSMEKAMPRKDAIEAATDRAMYDRHGDIMRDGTIEEAALEAVHNDKRGQWLAAELKAVAEVADAGPTMTAKQSREIARQTISRMRVRDAMASQRFLAAERKAGKEAAALGAMLAREGVWMNNARRRIATKARAALREDGTVDAVAAQVDQANASTGNYNETVAKLLDAKRRQLLNHALYSEARKVADEVAKAERLAASFTKSEKRKKIAGAGRRENAQIDYLGAIDEILDRYDFRRMSGAAEQRRGALNLYVEQMTAAGRENELAIPEEVLAQAQRLPYKTIPVEELRGVVDTLRNLEHTAGRWNKLIDAQKERDFTASVEDVLGAFDANVPQRPPGRVSSTAEDWRNTGRKFFDLVLNSTTLLREIDGREDFGPAYSNIKSPIDEAMNRLIVRKEQAATDLEALYDVYSKDERRAMGVRKYIDELGYSLSKWEMISVALNTGNEGNYQRLTDSRVKGHLTDDQVIAVLSRLDARDAKFVQSVWDYLETFRPDIAERERRATGVQPDWVEAKPVEIAGIELKGGYYPLKYDPRLSSLARDDEMANLAQSMQAGRFGKAQTRNGHLKERGASSGRDVELDMSVLHRHVNQVMYDLELSEPVTNSWRILQDGRVRDRFVQSGRQADFDALEAWLKDVAEGEVKSADFVGRAARTMKSNFTAAKLAFNFSTVAMQITGLSQSMVVVGKQDFAVGVMQSFRGAARDEIVMRSPYMKTRQTTFNKDIYDFYNDPKMGPVASRWGDFKQNIIGPLSFWLMTKVQYHLVDVPTWLAGYNTGLRKFGNDETKAVAYADDVVKRAQSSGLFSDRSAIERGSVSAQTRQNDAIRLFTTLASYMFAKFNVAYERSATMAQTVRQEGISLKSAQEALSWTIDMAFLFTLEAVVTAAIKGGLPGGDDDDDEALAAEWMKFLAKETAFSAMGTVPFIRDIASFTQGFESGGGYGGIVADIGKPFKEIAQGEFDKGFVKSVIGATGLATGLPATQINRAVDAAWREAEGEDVSVVEYFLGKPRKSAK